MRPIHRDKDESDVAANWRLPRFTYVEPRDRKERKNAHDENTGRLGMPSMTAVKWNSKSVCQDRIPVRGMKVVDPELLTDFRYLGGF